MRRRSLAVGVGLALATGAIAVTRRRRTPAARLDVFYEDGSMVRLDPGTAEAARMLGAARQAIAAVRPAA